VLDQKRVADVLENDTLPTGSAACLCELTSKRFDNFDYRRHFDIFLKRVVKPADGGNDAAVVGSDAVALPSGRAAAAFGMRMELQQPGLQIFPSSHAYDVFTTAHGLIMIFFMVMLALIGVR
jgi:hypothetical protein